MGIKVLDKSVYELIAAGEVIERPSSVVKELVENSIDAGADKITVEIRHGGRSYIRVTDNGCGILFEEIPIAFERHATSKINTQEDLNAIGTLGFRGEALASVCAVSKVELTTKRREDEFGSFCTCEAGEITALEETGCPDGTTFIIRDLFYNVPARLKFLKKDVSEGNSIANVVSKIALSRPDISFKFIRDGKTETVTPGDGRLLSSIYSVLGKDFYGTLIPLDYSLNGVTVTGYITKPLGARANRSFQNFFVNQRYVKSVTAMVALEEAYRNQIMVGKFPGCVLMIEIDPASTDVNVHPAKLEIRFSNEKPVYDAVYFAVKNALMISDDVTDSAPSPKAQTLSRAEIFRQPEPETEQLTLSSSQAAHIGMPEENKEPNKPFIGITDSFYEKRSDIEISEKPKDEKVYKEPDIPKNRENIIPKPEEAAKDIPTNDPVQENITVLGEVFKTYIVAQRGEDMFLIDKHAAHERYNFEKLRNGIAEVECQELLNPFDITLSYDSHTAVKDNTELLEKFGFRLEILPAPEVRICGVPILLTEDDPADILTETADRLSVGGIHDKDGIFDELFHSVACKASIKANRPSAKEELQHLAELVIENDIRYCPHGRPAIIKFTKYELEKMFKRVV